MVKDYYKPVNWERNNLPNPRGFLPVVIGILILLALIFWFSSAHAEEVKLQASWYSIESLKKEGTWKYSKGVMANGRIFNNYDFTCATRLYALGSYLSVTNLVNGKTVKVKVTDRIGKRFAKSRIDLSKAAFAQIADLKQGLIPIKVEVIHD